MPSSSTTVAVGIAFTTPDGQSLVLPVHPDLAAARDFANGKIKHVQSAIRWGLDGGEHADTAARYVQTLAWRQETTGADWLDLNADEVSAESAIRAEAIAWLVDHDRGDGRRSRCRSTRPTSPCWRRASRRRRGRPGGCCSTRRRSSARRSWTSLPSSTARSSSRPAGHRGMPAERRGAGGQRDRAHRARDGARHRGRPALRGPARAARGGLEPTRRRTSSTCARQLRAEYGDGDPPDRRPVQRVVRHAEPQAAQRHVHRPVPPRPASTAGSSTRSRRTWRACSPRTATASRTGWPRTCCWAGTRSAASTSLAFRAGRLGAE